MSPDKICTANPQRNWNISLIIPPEFLKGIPALVILTPCSNFLEVTPPEITKRVSKYKFHMTRVNFNSLKDGCNSSVVAYSLSFLSW